MAVYMCEDQIDASVGPVRSARYFNVDLFQQLRGVTFHFGGAGKVMSRLDQSGVKRVNGLTDAWSFFWRGGPWGAPHDVYLDVDAARHEMEEGGLEAMSKKEQLMFQRELDKLEKDIGGIQDMNTLPDALFIVDVGSIPRSPTLGLFLTICIVSIFASERIISHHLTKKAQARA